MTDTDNCQGSWCQRDSNCAASCCYMSTVVGEDQYFCTIDESYCPQSCVDVRKRPTGKRFLCEGGTCTTDQDCAASCCEEGTCGGGTCNDTCSNWYQSWNTQTNICEGGTCASDSNCLIGTCVSTICTNPPDDSANLLWLWIVLGIVGLGLLLWLIHYLLERKKKLAMTGGVESRDFETPGN